MFVYFVCGVDFLAIFQALVVFHYTVNYDNGSVEILSYISEMILQYWLIVPSLSTQNKSEIHAFSDSGLLGVR